MRYNEIQNIDFTNSRGEVRVLKELRPLEKSVNFFEIENNRTDFLDLLATKVYGNNAEAMWYKIADQNIEQIVERKFDLTAIKVYQVPRV